MNTCLCLLAAVAFVAVQASQNIDNGSTVQAGLSQSDPENMVTTLCHSVCGMLKSYCIDVPGANKCSDDEAMCHNTCGTEESCIGSCEKQCKVEYNCQNPSAETIDDLECDGKYEECADGCAATCSGSLGNKLAIKVGKLVYKNYMTFMKAISS